MLHRRMISFSRPAQWTLFAWPPPLAGGLCADSVVVSVALSRRRATGDFEAQAWPAHRVRSWAGPTLFYAPAAKADRRVALSAGDALAVAVVFDAAVATIPNYSNYTDFVRLFYLAGPGILVEAAISP